MPDVPDGVAVLGPLIGESLIVSFFRACADSLVNKNSSRALPKLCYCLIKNIHAPSRVDGFVFPYRGWVSDKGRMGRFLCDGVREN